MGNCRFSRGKCAVSSHKKEYFALDSWLTIRIKISRMCRSERRQGKDGVLDMMRDFNSQNLITWLAKNSPLLPSFLVFKSVCS